MSGGLQRLPGTNARFYYRGLDGHDCAHFNISITANIVLDISNIVSAMSRVNWPGALRVTTAAPSTGRSSSARLALYLEPGGLPRGLGVTTVLAPSAGRSSLAPLGLFFEPGGLPRGLGARGHHSPFTFCRKVLIGRFGLIL